MTTAFKPRDPAWREKVRESFARQPMMAHLGVVLGAVEPGRVTLALRFRRELTQHTGVLHAGALTTLADSACGWAAFTLMPPGTEPLSVDFTMHLLRPAIGARVEARATVLRPGRTITAVRADVVAIDEAGAETLVAAMQATMIAQVRA